MRKFTNFFIRTICLFAIYQSGELFGQIPSSLVSSYVHVDVTRSDFDYTTSQPTVLVDNLLGFEQDLTQNVSPYGGLLNTQLTATGYFYTKKINGRWWFVDPEGHLMLYLGINELRHDAADGFSPFASAAEWGNTVLTYFKDHGIYSGGGWSGRSAMNFSEQMNFAETRNWLRDFYISLGNASPGGEKYIPLNPVFHPDWNTFVAQKASELANEYAGDPRFIGIFSGNELRFDTDILIDCLNLNANDYNYQHAVQWVQNFRGDNDPVTTSNVTSAEMNEFFRLYIESYYKPIYDAIKLYAPNHLCLGSRVYQTALMENKIFVETYAKYVDVMSFNRYSYWTEPRSLMDGLAEWADKPWIVTEFYAKGSDIPYYNNVGGAGWIVPTQQERGYYYQNQTLTWLQHKSCAGWHWFRYRDENYTTVEDASNKGLVDLYHNPHEAVMTQVKQLNRQYLKLAEYFDNETYAGITENTIFADFRADKTVIDIGESVTFTDQSTGSPNSWSWSFGGGTPSVSTSQNPTVTYDTPGTYTIELTASNASGSNMVIKTEYITVNNVANYYVSEDAYVRDGIYSNDNYGSEESLFIKEASEDFRRVSFLQFDISGLTDPIESVKLLFYGNGQTTTGEVLLKKVSDDSWSENSITYNNMPIIGSDLEQKLISAATYYSIDITDYVLAEKAIDGVVSMAIVGNENSTITIWSKESTRKPFIKITVLPTNAPPAVNAGADQTAAISANLPWSPAFLSPAAWYDAADRGTITASSGAVSQWSDKSGNGNHVTQATSASQPTTQTRTLNGLNVIDFDGSDDELLDSTFPSLSSLNLSVFAVQQHDRLDVQSMTAWGLGRNTSTDGLIFHSSYDSSFTFGYRYPENKPVYYAENTNAELLSYVKSGTSSQQAWVDGVSKGVNTNTVTTFTTQRLALGSRFSANYLNGAIGEFIVMPSAVPEEDRQKVEGYLAHKWGFEGNLPTNHAYKSAAPVVTGASVVLDGASVTDPDGDTLSQTWTVVSAPAGGTAVFENANLVSATVTLDSGGEYVLRLTAADGITTAFDEVRIIVTDTNSTATVNGTPYAWLDSFGITNDYELADLGDPDGDGALTWQEYQAGTDPTNAMSVFRLMSATIGVSGDLELVWYGTTNSGVTTAFVVYRCTNLLSGGWEPVSTNTRSATGTNTWSGSGAPGAAFYRIGM